MPFNIKSTFSQLPSVADAEVKNYPKTRKSPWISTTGDFSTPHTRELRQTNNIPGAPQRFGFVPVGPDPKPKKQSVFQRIKNFSKNKKELADYNQMSDASAKQTGSRVTPDSPNYNLSDYNQIEPKTKTKLTDRVKNIFGSKKVKTETLNSPSLSDYNQIEPVQKNISIPKEQNINKSLDTPKPTETPTIQPAIDTPASNKGFWKTPSWKRNVAIGGIGVGAGALGAYLWNRNKKKKQALQKSAIDIYRYYY